MKFTEDSRVKIPTIIHLNRLGYNYLSLNDVKCDEKTNIFSEIFIETIVKINEGIENKDAQRLMEDVKLTLENETTVVSTGKNISLERWENTNKFREREY